MTCLPGFPKPKQPLTSLLEVQVGEVLGNLREPWGVVGKMRESLGGY